MIRLDDREIDRGVRLALQVHISIGLEGRTKSEVAFVKIGCLCNCFGLDDGVVLFDTHFCFISFTCIVHVKWTRKNMQDVCKMILLETGERRYDPRQTRATEPGG